MDVIPGWAWLILLVAAIVFVYAFRKFFSSNEVDLTNPGQSRKKGFSFHSTPLSIEYNSEGSPDEDEGEEEQELIEDISNYDVDDLLDEAEMYDDHEGEIADAMVARALELKNELSPNDWVSIYKSIQTNGASKETARKMAGDALQEENQAVAVN